MVARADQRLPLGTIIFIRPAPLDNETAFPHLEDPPIHTDQRYQLQQPTQPICYLDQCLFLGLLATGGRGS